jgi:hypothetical protein
MGYKKEARKVLLDALLYPYGVMWHGYKGNFGMTEENSIYIKDEKVFVSRLCPLKFIYDPSVNISNLGEAQWVGRIINVRLRDVIEDDKLNVSKGLKGYAGFGQKVGTYSSLLTQSSGGDNVNLTPYSKKSLLEYSTKDYQQSTECKFIKIYEIFHRPTKAEARDGKKGKILLLCEEQEKPLRESEWTIKAEGFPTKILEFNELPDAFFGLSDVDTYKVIADQKNVVINLQLRNAQETAKTWVGISKQDANEEDIIKVQKGTNSIITFESGNPRDRMFVSQGGGQASSELYMLDGRIQKNLEDKSGVSDLKRGFLQSGEESATSVKIRSAGGSARPMYRQDIMADFLKESFHYINQLLKQFTPYKDAVRIVGTLDLEWSENPSLDEIQAETDVDIDVYSMLPDNPETELQQLTTVLNMAMQAITQPVIWNKLQQEGKTMNLSPIIQQILMRMKFRDPDAFRNIKASESQGFVSVEQIREAKQNVTASLEGATIDKLPFPPKMEDDHRAKLEVYGSIQELLTKAGQMSEVLNQLIMIQQSILAEIESKESNVGEPVKLTKKQMNEVGT